MNKFKKGDTVFILTGKDKGKSGKILSVYPTKKTVLVDGINIVKRHLKHSDKTKSAIVDVVKPLNWSKVAHIGSGNARESISFSLQDGKKVRLSKKSHKVIG